MRTIDLWEQACSTESIEELRMLLKTLENEFVGGNVSERWKQFICNECVARGKKNIDIARYCDVSSQTIVNWKKKGVLPAKRDTFIRFALGCGMSVEDTDRMLQNFGCYPKLYAHNLNDLLYIFVLNKMQTAPDTLGEYADSPFSYYIALKERVYSKLSSLDSESERERTTLSPDYKRTAVLNDDIAGIHNEEKLIDYISDNQIQFPKMSYIRFYQYIRDFCDAQLGVGNISINSLCSDGFFAKSFNKVVSELKRKGVLPSRNEVISIGIQLGMTVDMLNRFLEAAKYNPLYPRDIHEMVIIFALTSVHLIDPTLEYNLAYHLAKFATDENVRSENMDTVKLLNSIGQQTQEYVDSVANYVADVFEQLGMMDSIRKYCCFLPDAE